MTVWLLATFPVLFVFLFGSFAASRHAPPLPCCSHETTELKATNVRWHDCMRTNQSHLALEPRHKALAEAINFTLGKPEMQLPTAEWHRAIWVFRSKLWLEHSFAYSLALPVKDLMACVETGGSFLKKMKLWALEPDDSKPSVLMISCQTRLDIIATEPPALQTWIKTGGA